jgi:hypothetical protein
MNSLILRFTSHQPRRSRSPAYAEGAVGKLESRLLR